MLGKGGGRTTESASKRVSSTSVAGRDDREFIRSAGFAGGADRGGTSQGTRHRNHFSEMTDEASRVEIPSESHALRSDRTMLRLGRRLNRSGYFVMLLVACVSLFAGEWLPFSRLPMYSKPRDTVRYFYISDLDDQPLPTNKELGVRCSRLRKAFDAHCSQERGSIDERERRAAAKTLRDAVERKPDREKRAGYRLWRVDIRLCDGGVVRDPRVVAQWP